MNLPISSQGCIVQEFTAEWKALLIYYEQVLRPRLRGAHRLTSLRFTGRVNTERELPRAGP